MKLLDRYIIRRLSTIGLFSVVLFTVSWLAPEILFNAIQYVTHHTLTLEQGLLYLFYQIPEVLGYCLPISTLFASIFLLRQLSLSGELIAIMASGISFRRLLIPVAAVGLGSSLLFFLAQEVLNPWTSFKLGELNRQTHFNANKLLEPQVTFIERSPKGAMEKFLIISPWEHKDQSRFIFLFYEGSGDDIRIGRIITALDGTWIQHLNRWELRQGVDYRLSIEGIYKNVESFERRLVKSSAVAHSLLMFPTGSPSEFRIKQLEQYTRLLTRSGQTEDARFYKVRLYQRYFLPWIPLILALLGASIGIERSRARRNLGLTYAAVLLLVYNILVPVTTTLGSIGVLPTVVAAFTPLVLTTASGMAIIQLRKLEG